MEKAEKIRDSRFELMRIIIMLMIIIMHYFNGEMGGALENIENNTMNCIVMNIIESFCIPALNCFILITGFYMIQKEDINLIKIIKLIFTLLFTNLLAYYGMILIGEQNLTIRGIIKSFLPIVYDVNWFIVIYSILYLFIPYINKLLKQLTQKQYQLLLGFSISFFYIWPTFVNNITIKDNGYGIINFIVLYLIGAYLKLYKKKNKHRCIYLFIYIVMCIIIWGYHEMIPNKGWAYNTIFCLIASISFFLYFYNLKISNKKVINALASTMFTVYIVHVNPFLTNWIWHKLLHCEIFYQSNYFIIHMLFSSLTVLSIGICIGYAFNKIVGIIIQKLIKEFNWINKIIRV